MEKIILKGPEIHLSDDEFFSFCQHNADLTIERRANKEIIIMSPTGSLTGFYNTKIVVQLELWNEKHQQGLVFDSSAGFTLPDGSVKSADASWLSLDQWKKLSSTEQEKFAPVCPEFVVELKSKSDSLPELKTKMEEWLANGVQLGWLIDPGQETVYVYRPDHEVSKVTGFEQTISGDPVLASFQLNLAKLRHP
ncbi:MAG: Uma2 family endonuclease [Cyclobacteriaceae bacterium]|mgnify:CR=1 FL=1